MIDALAIVIPFIIVSALLLKVLAYSQAHNRPTHGWYVALVGGSLSLLAMILIHFFPTFDFSISFIDYAIVVFGAGVLLRPIAQAKEQGRFKGRFGCHIFYVAMFILAAAALMLLLPAGFYGFTSPLSLWAERLVTAALWVLFAKLYAKQDIVEGQVALLTVIICVALSVMAKGVALFALIVAGCCLGFMRLNRPPMVNNATSKARTAQMGFTGSFWLGFILFGLALISLIPHPLSNAGCLALLTLFLYPLADSAQAVVISVFKKTPFRTQLWAAKLLGSGADSVPVLLRTIGIHFLLFLFSIFGYVTHQSLYTLLLGAFILAIYHLYVLWLCKVK